VQLAIVHARNAAEDWVGQLSVTVEDTARHIEFLHDSQRLAGLME
jgi:hypothetical protein